MSTTVQTHFGALEGIRSDDLLVFKGIPYAAPPTGERRWLPPAPPAPWTGVRSARVFRPQAPQPERPPGTPLSALGDHGLEESEDCLYLNVWTPGLDGARPVMVWIHGGAFRTGAGSGPIYDGARLARRGDVVVVTLNYRLGALGFMNLAELTGGRIPATGNEGLLDQVAALEWVRDHIAGFGGDPDNVTIFGESAGGMSVGSLLGLPAARGLFHRAIAQSGACHTAHPLARGVRVAERMLEKLGVDPTDADALRAVPPERLVAAGTALSLAGDRELGGMIFQPVLDGAVLARLPFDSVRDGSADGVPVLVGSTLEEWALFAAMDPRSGDLDEAGLRGRLAARLEADAIEPLIEAYREARSARGDATAPSDLFTAIETDRVFRLPAVRLAEALAERGQQAYGYLFTWPSPLLEGRLGACHAVELGFVFGTHDLNPGMASFFGSGPAATALSEATQEAWLAFARTGNPSNDLLGAWPAYGHEGRATMVLGEKSRLEPDPLPSERIAWSRVKDDAGPGRL